MKYLLFQPVPLHDAEILLPDRDHQFQKATILDDIPRGSVLYPFFIKDKISATPPHMLGACSPKELEEWTETLYAAKAARVTFIPT